MSRMRSTFTPRWLQATVSSLSPLTFHRLGQRMGTHTALTCPCRWFAASSLSSILSRVSRTNPSARADLFSSPHHKPVAAPVASRPSPASSSPPPSSPSVSPSAPPTTLIPSSSPYHQEDATLERVAITGYDAWSFDIFAPSALPRGQSADGTVIEATGVSAPMSTSLTLPTYVAPEPASAVGGRAVKTPIATIAMNGGILALPTAVFLWAPKVWSDVTVDSLAVIDVLQSPPELILFGTGHTVQPLPPALASYLSTRGIGYEVLQSGNAAATFNLLVEEDRLVMAALVPYGREVTDENGEEVEEDKEMERPSAQLRQQIEDQLLRRQ